MNKDNTESIHENHFVKIPSNWKMKSYTKNGPIYLELNNKQMLRLKKKELTKKLDQV